MGDLFSVFHYPDLFSRRRRDAALLQHRHRILDKPLPEVGIRPGIGDEQMPLHLPVAVFVGHNVLLGKCVEPLRDYLQKVNCAARQPAHNLARQPRSRPGLASRGSNHPLTAGERDAIA